MVSYRRQKWVMCLGDSSDREVSGIIALEVWRAFTQRKQVQKLCLRNSKRPVGLEGVSQGQ